MGRPNNFHELMRANENLWELALSTEDCIVKFSTVKEQDDNVMFIFESLVDDPAKCPERYITIRFMTCDEEVVFRITYVLDSYKTAEFSFKIQEKLEDFFSTAPHKIAQAFHSFQTPGTQEYVTKMFSLESVALVH